MQQVEVIGASNELSCVFSSPPETWKRKKVAVEAVVQSRRKKGSFCRREKLATRFEGKETTAKRLSSPPPSFRKSQIRVTLGTVQRRPEKMSHHNSLKIGYKNYRILEKLL